jgi:hypothetical protein
MPKNKKNILNHLLSALVIMIIIIPFLVQAADPGGGASTPTPGGGGSTPTPGGGTNMNIIIVNPFKQDTIEGLINVVLNDILIPIGGVVAVIMVMYAGFLFVTARGNEAQITKAKQALLYAVIGAAILLGAKVISDAISKTITQLKVST